MTAKILFCAMGYRTGIALLDARSLGRLRLGPNYSSVLASHRTASVRSMRFVHEANAEIPHHSHERAHLFFLIDGKMGERTGNNYQRFDPGFVTYHPAGAEHDNCVGPSRTDSIGIEFDDDFIVRTNPMFDLQTGRSHFGPAPGCSALALELDEELQSQSPSAAAIECLAGAFVQELFSKPDAQRPAAAMWLSDLARYLEDHCDSEPDIARLADRAGRNPSHMMRAFNASFGVTIGEYRRVMLVRRACTLLKDKSASLAGVAAACGFSDQSHFGRVFRRVMNMTPAHFRSSARILN